MIHKPKIHIRIGNHYLCNRACYITESKGTTDPEEVTCLNCKHLLEKKDFKDCLKCGGKIKQVRKAFFVCTECKQEYISDFIDMLK